MEEQELLDEEEGASACKLLRRQCCWMAPRVISEANTPIHRKFAEKVHRNLQILMNSDAAIADGDDGYTF